MLLRMSTCDSVPLRSSCRSLRILLKLIHYSCSSYPTRASYSSQVDEFRNPMKNKLKTRPCLKPTFEMISNTDANFVNLHIDKAAKTGSDKQLRLNHTFYETNFKPKLFTASIECNSKVIKRPLDSRL